MRERQRQRGSALVRACVPSAALLPSISRQSQWSPWQRPGHSGASRAISEPSSRSRDTRQMRRGGSHPRRDVRGRSSAYDAELNAAAALLTWLGTRSGTPRAGGGPANYALLSLVFPCCSAAPAKRRRRNSFVGALRRTMRAPSNRTRWLACALLVAGAARLLTDD